MAAVYQARHSGLDQTRAVKVLSSHLTSHEGFVRLFYREARLAAGLSHRNIVMLYDVGEQDGIPYIVMELLRGRPLRDVVRNDQPLPLKRTIHFIRQLAAA